MSIMSSVSSVAASRFVSLITRDTLALVLAGGRGTRLGGLTSHRVKPAVPFGGRYRIVDFPLSNCINSGIRRVGVMTQYKSHSLIHHLQSGWGFLRGEFGEFIETLPAQQRTGGSWYSGTADAVYQNIEIIREHDPRFVLVLGGDHIYKMDYGMMLGFHANRGAKVTVGCIPVPLERGSTFGVMVVDAAGRVTGFEEKPATPAAMPDRPNQALASMGIYVFDADYLLQALARDAANAASQHDFGKDILPEAVRAEAVYGYPFIDTRTGNAAYWRDVGDIDSYWEANLELIGVVPELNLYDAEWPIWTACKHSPPAKFVFNDEQRRGMALDSMVAEGCIVSGAAVRHSLLFRDVNVDEGAMIDDAVVLSGVSIGRHCRVRRAIIETGCMLPDGTSIGFDPVADARRFHVTPRGVVLVTPEMLGQSLAYVR